jgi:hypothetical protein
MSDNAGKGRFALPPNLYDVLKDVALIYLPAFGTLYFALAGIWGFGYAEQVMGTVVSVSTFMGVCLKISKTSYDNSDKGKDGVLVVDQSGPTDVYRLDVTTPLDEVADKKTITLKIDNDRRGGSMDPRLIKPSSR